MSIILAMTIISEFVSQQRTENNYLLPSLQPADVGKKCMVIDLDETLVHSSFKVSHNRLCVLCSVCTVLCVLCWVYCVVCTVLCVLCCVCCAVLCVLCCVLCCVCCVVFTVLCGRMAASIIVTAK